MGIRVSRSIAALAAATLLLAACGSGASTSTGGGSKPSVSSGGASASGSSGKTVIMKVGYATVGDIQDFAAKAYVAKINQLSGGKIKATAYDGQKLGSNTQVNEGIISGAVQGTTDIPGFYGQFIPLMQALDAPFLFPESGAAIMKILSSSAMKPLDQAALAKGFRIVGWQYASPTYIWAKKPVRTPADLKGLKIRSFGSPIVTHTVQEWGAVPVSMPPASLYTALSQGTVNAAEFGMDTSFGFKTYEVAPYATDFGGVDPVIEPMAVSEVWFKKLPANLQKDILQAGQWETSHWRQTVAKWQATNGKIMKKHMPAGHVITWGANLRKVLVTDNQAAYQSLYKTVPGSKTLIEKIRSMEKG